MRHIYPLIFLLLLAFGVFCGCSPAESASSEPPPEDPPAPAGCTSIVLSPAELTLGAGRTAALTLTWEPKQAPAPQVDWRSSDDTIASIPLPGKSLLMLLAPPFSPRKRRRDCPHTAQSPLFRSRSAPAA